MGRRIAAFAALALAVVVPAGADGPPGARPVAFRESSFSWIPWVETVEAARARGKEGGRLVLAFLFPYDGRAYEAGYDGAGAVRAFPPAVAPAEAEAQRTRDPGFLKEQAVLAVLLGDPDVAALVSASFVPVRMRLHTWHFFDGGPGPYTDPLRPLGTSARETRPPAIVLATPDGRLVHRIERMGVFDPHAFHRLLLEILRKNARFRPKPKAGVDARVAVEALAAAGDLDAARRRLGEPEADEEAWIPIWRARIDAFEGSLGKAEVGLRGLPSDADRDALLASVLLRLARPAAVEALPALGASARGRAALAYALERLGRATEAEALWRLVLDADREGPLGARAVLHLATDGPRAREWETLEDHGLAPLATTTVVGRGGEEAAVRYLLAQQDADGSWRDPRGSQAALDVPRTALCACALRAWRDADDPARVDAAVDRAVASVRRFSDAPTGDVWSLTYALHLELDLLAETPSGTGRARVERLLDSLGRLEHDGGWTYMAGPPRLHTFNTAPILLSLLRARPLGVAVEDRRIERAVRFLERNRVDGTRVFHYGTTMEHMSGEKGKTDEKSTCMRSALCELALHVAGAERSAKGVSEAVDLFLEHAASARSTQKIFESYVDVTNLQDSYRWFFGAWYAAQAANRLPEGRRAKAAARIAATVRAAQEVDGSFVDSQTVGKSTSTALALLALAETRAR